MLTYYFNIFQEFTEDCLDLTEAPAQNNLSVTELEETVEDQQLLLHHKTNFLKEMFKIIIDGLRLSVVSNGTLSLTFSSEKNYIYVDLSEGLFTLALPQMN